MKLVTKVESWMVAVSKGLPNLSVQNKDMLVKAWPWLALISGILQLLSALGLWNFLQQAQRLGLFSEFVGYRINQLDIVMAYVSIALLVLTAILLLVAYSPLKAHARRGWELLFIVGLINVLSGLASLFITGRGIGAFLFSLLVSAIVFYLLLQVRERYGAAKSSATAHAKSEAKRTTHQK